jgi:transposase
MARSLLTRGPFPAEAPEAQQQSVPVSKRTASEVQEKVAPAEGRYKANLPFPLLSGESVRPAEGERVRYYLGVDWADQTHAVWVVDEHGTKVAARMVPHTAEGLSEWGRELDQWRAQGIELWAAIERPEGRVVDFLLDHGTAVYPVNPQALDRARDRFRQSGAKSDPFDARVLADFLRTDHTHLRALRPSSDAAQELKLLTEDYQRQIREQTRLVNQLTATLKAYYPRALEVAELTTALAREFLQAYPTPDALATLTARRWQQWARAHRVSEARTRQLWDVLQQPQLPVPAHVVRTKARLMSTLVSQLAPVLVAVTEYREAIEGFFAGLPAAQWARTLPIGEHGITAPTLWARLGDAPGRWESFRHLQAQAGTVPVTKRSGKQHVVHFRFACDKALRYVVDHVAFLSLRSSEWARAYYDKQRARGHSHRHALRALGAKWLKIIFVMWQRQTPYDEQYHLATMTRQRLRQQEKLA